MRAIDVINVCHWKLSGYYGCGGSLTWHNPRKYLSFYTNFAILASLAVVRRTFICNLKTYDMPSLTPNKGDNQTYNPV